MNKYSPLVSNESEWFGSRFVDFKATHSKTINVEHESFKQLELFLAQSIAKLEGIDITNEKSFTYNDFWLPEEEDDETEGDSKSEGGIAPKIDLVALDAAEVEEKERLKVTEHKNALAIWLKHIQDEKEKYAKVLEDRQKRMIEELIASGHMIPVLADPNPILRKPVTAAPEPTIRPAPSFLQKTKEELDPNRTIQFSSGPVATYPAIIYSAKNWSRLAGFSTGALISFGASAGASAIVGGLVKSTSYVAIASAIGIFGLTGVPAAAISIAGVVTAAAIAGGGAACVAKYARNIAPVFLQKDLDEAAKKEIYKNAWSESFNREVFVRGAITGTVGGVVGTALQHVGDVISLFDPQTVASVPVELSSPPVGHGPVVPPTANDLHMSGNSVNMDGVPVAETHTSAFLKGQADAVYAAEHPVELQTDGALPVDPKPDMPNPSYLHNGSAINTGVDNLSDEQVNAMIVKHPEMADTTAAAPAIKFDFITGANAAEMPAQADAHIALTPDHNTHTVVKGDALENIVKDEYNIKDATVDLDKDGISDLDEAMAAVSKENGLVGNQQNGLKVKWELKLPSLNLDTVTEKIDRVSLDANWRSGNIPYSDVPKFAV